MYIPTISQPWSIESVTICQSGRSSLRAMCNKLYLTLHKTTPTVGLSTCLGVMPELRVFQTSETWCVRHETRINNNAGTRVTLQPPKRQSRGYYEWLHPYSPSQRYSDPHQCPLHNNNYILHTIKTRRT